ncbi:MAG: DUF5686 and carboxypeptidase regulatory-like domain-containing protein [Bacteroidota bacterium]
MIGCRVAVLFFFLIFAIHVDAQIQGVVTDGNGEALPFVNIYFEGSLSGTTTNDNGYYQIELSETGSHTLVFKYIGFRTKKQVMVIDRFPYTLNVALEEESVQLAEVQVSANDNPANRIIRNAIAKRKEYRKKRASYTADFYSKGLIRIKDAPKRILGQDLGDMGGGLDSTRSGIIYLSETISKIAVDKNDYKEKILASKVSGDDNGFSFNNASDVDFSYYNNTVEFGNQLVSPIADNAFSYYRYRLIGTFYDDQNNLINQIAVTPKRPKDRVFTGTLYIVEDYWAIYASDFKVTGEQTQIVPVDTLVLKQDFNYSKQYDLWVKVLQSTDFSYNIFGVKGNGRFTAAYKNYDLQPNFGKKAFTNEVLSFAEASNKKDSVFWGAERPVPLTQEETEDYREKDSLQIIRKSQKYLDSVDVKGNRFSLGSLFFGYTRKNTFKEKSFSVSAPLTSILFNTVQGWYGRIGLDYTKRSKEKGTRLAIGTKLEYGDSDRRFRPIGEISYRFDNFSRPFLRLRGGNQVAQFNGNNPITAFGNTITSLFFENNFAKFYEKNFVDAFYSREVVNGIYLYLGLAFEERKPLFNTTGQVILGDNEEPYTSNNPLAPNDFNNAAISTHNIWKFSATARIRFGQKYLSYPDGKFSYSEDRFPTLFLGYEKGFASSVSQNNFDQIKLRLIQDFNIADKGEFAYNLRAGAFVNGDDISFVDYRHFNGNRTRITRNNYLDAFFLLPYYDLSTNRSYLEGHVEHNFKGYIMGKIPLLKKLNSHLIVSAKYLSTNGNRPYTEYGISLGNLGWKKFRFLRLGYVLSHFQGVTERGFNMGIQF